MVIAGGTGFLGRSIERHFIAAGHDVVILGRSAGDGVTGWDARTLGSWTSVLEGADVLINLAGRSVDCRYTTSNRRVIRDSRTASTRVLGEALQRCANGPRIWLNSSTATIYPDTRGDAPANTEANEPGSDFSMDVAKAWEAAFFSAELPGVRRVALRICIVLGSEGGAMVPLRALTRLGLGGKQGPGSQWVTWIHIEDLLRQVEFIIAHDELQGVVNCTGPEPVSNQMFMAAMRRACNRRFGLPQPGWLLRFGSRLIQTEAELVLKSRKVISPRLADAGFTWQWPDLDTTLADLCQPRSASKR